MAIALEQADNARCVRLEGSIDISSAEELKKILVDALKTGDEIRLLWSGVTYLDVTAIQLLWAAEREAAGKGAKFTYVEPIPEPIRSALRDAGFEDSFFAGNVNRSAGEMA